MMLQWYVSKHEEVRALQSVKDMECRYNGQMVTSGCNRYSIFGLISNS